jgi:hypothetical protein
MKLMKKNLKIILVLTFSLLLVSCGSKWSSGAGAYGYNGYGTCDISSSGENVYSGVVSPAGMYFWYNEGNLGELKLQINQGGTVQGQFSANASLTLNGINYCCNPNGGMSGILEQNFHSNGVKYGIDNVQLLCTATNSMSYSGGYVVLTIGEDYASPFEGMYFNAELTTDNRIRGIISVSSSQNLSPIPNGNKYYFWVE